MQNPPDRSSSRWRLVVGVALALAVIALDAWAIGLLGADAPVLGELVMRR